jgi:predicted small lipoprotein YifL
MTPRILIPVVLLAAISLSACGKQGLLDRPAPLFGARAQSDYQRAKRAADRANGESNSAQSATSQTNGDYTQGNDGAKDPALQPLRNDPIPGANPNPFGTRPMPGVLPDPYADPNRTPR